MPSKQELEQHTETATSDELLGALKSKALKAPGKKPLPRVKFTGQQPGEESVERDKEPGPDDDERDEKRDDDGEKIVPIGDPPSKRKPSTEGKFSA